MKYYILVKDLTLNETKLIETNVSNYDEHTLYLSSKIKGNEHLNDLPGYADKYMLIDKKTGLVVCSTLKQKNLKEKYESVKIKYEQHRKTNTYSVQIKEYELKMNAKLKD